MFTAILWNDFANTRAINHVTLCGVNNSDTLPLKLILKYPLLDFIPWGPWNESVYYIMGLTTQDPHIQKEHTKLYRILKFCVNRANIEQDTAIQKLQNLQTNVWIAGHLSGNHTFLCKFWSFWMAISCSILTQLTGNLRLGVLFLKIWVLRC